MKTHRMILAGMCMLWSHALVGCTPSQEEMAKMMQQPPRPAELDRLEAFLGSWKAEGQVQIKGMDKIEPTSGKNTTDWSTDKWILVENWQHDMGKDNTMKGVSMTWWDANSKKYRSFWVDNYGGHGQGSMTYDEESKTWKMKGKSKDGKTGHKTTGKGTMTMVNPSEMRWTWEEYDSLGLFKFFEINGTSERQ